MNIDEAFKIAIENGWATFKGHKIDSVRLLNSGVKDSLNSLRSTRDVLQAQQLFLTMDFFSILYSGSPWARA
jgi:hypothetical protein